MSRGESLSGLCRPGGVAAWLLFAALRRADPPRTILATVLAFAGLTLVLATPTGLSMLPLADRYAAATTEEARAPLLAAGETILATDIWHSTSAFVGGLLLQGAAVLVSVVMWRTRVFSRTTAWVGILTHGLDLAHIVVGRRLLQLGEQPEDSG